jgi:hypothetical protein
MRLVDAVAPQKSDFARFKERLLGRTGEIPMNQVNAIVPERMQLRVGIPHRGGKLAAHAFERGYPVMVSANAFFDPRSETFKVPQYSPLQDMDVALDSAGFVALMNFVAKGPQKGAAGIYPWRYGQYLELAYLLRPNWFAAMDLCCENSATNGGIDTDWRIRATATMLEGMLDIIEAWQEEYAKDVSATTVANDLKPPVAVCQGWVLDDYLKSLDLTMEVWNRHAWLAPPALMGLGSTCRRDLHHPKHGLFAILDGLDGRLPAGLKLHCFGVKGTALERVKMYPFVVGTDSMAFDVTARRNAFAAGISNTMEHRSTVMTTWMQAAEARMRPQPGDQFRLTF